MKMYKKIVEGYTGALTLNFKYDGTDEWVIAGTPGIQKSVVFVPVEAADIETVIRNAINYASDSTAWTSPLDGWQIDDIVEDALHDLGITKGYGELRNQDGKGMLYDMEAEDE